MSLHKKTRLFYVTIKEDFFKSHPFDIIRGMPNGREAIILYLELLTESIHHNGELRFSETLPFTNAILSGKFYTPIEIIESSMKLLTSMELVSIKGDGTIVVCDFQKHIGSRTYETIERNEALAETKNSSMKLKKDEQGTKNSSANTQTDEQGTNFATIDKILDTRVKINSGGGGNTRAGANNSNLLLVDYPKTFREVKEYIASQHLSIVDEDILFAKFIDLQKKNWHDGRKRPIMDWREFFVRMVQKQLGSVL